VLCHFILWAVNMLSPRLEVQMSAATVTEALTIEEIKGLVMVIGVIDAKPCVSRVVVWCLIGDDW
jgi:hypothetical protein